jgi:hypothetical protein
MKVILSHVHLDPFLGKQPMHIRLDENETSRWSQNVGTIFDRDFIERRAKTGKVVRSEFSQELKRTLFGRR